jgi:uncharacterized protein
VGPTLRQVQEAMAARLLGPARGELVDVGAQLDEWLHVPTPARTAERLHVYAGGYPARIQESLQETYPAVVRIIGAAEFHQLAQRYAASVALASYNLNDAGAQMPAFLRGDRLTRRHPFLPELAELEWRVAQAFHAEEQEPLDPRGLDWSLDDWARAVLRFQSALAVLSSDWPLLAVWAARDRASDCQPIARLDAPEHLIVRRAGFIVRCESVTAEEARALTLLLEDGHLFHAAEQLEAEGVEAGAVLEWFSRWMSAGMIAGASV